jgi:hypothetical protein
MTINVDTPEDCVEYYRQLLVYGEVILDDDGKIVHRKDPDYWVTRPRGYGKTAMGDQWRQIQEMIDRTYELPIMMMDEQIRRVIEGSDHLHRMAARWRMAPAQPATPQIGGVRWACRRPAQPEILPYAYGSYGWFLQNYPHLVTHPTTVVKAVS